MLIADPTVSSAELPAKDNSLLWSEFASILSQTNADVQARQKLRKLLKNVKHQTLRLQQNTML